MTIATLHTAGELSDLVNAFDVEVGALTQARDKAAADDSWASADPAGWAAWLADFATFLNAYNAAAGNAHDVVNSPVESLILTGTDASYTALLHAFQNGDTPSPGGFDDLNRRFIASPAAADMPSYTVPQPTAGDPDLNVINNPGVVAASNAGQAIANVGKTIAGALAQPSTWKWLGVGAAALGGLLLLSVVRSSPVGRAL